MSKFKVGDTVECTCGNPTCSVRGRVTSIDDDGGVLVGGKPNAWSPDALRLVAASPPAFRVGDRVEYVGPIKGIGNGVVDAVNESGKCGVRWLKGGYSCESASNLRATPPAAVAPTLETATGDGLDALAWSQWGASRDNGETDEQLRERCRRYGYTAERDRPAPGSVLPGSSGVTQAEWSEAIAKINAQAKALDTVRKFLASHSLESTTRRCQQEAREVMAVVLRSLDSDKAGK